MSAVSFAASLKPLYMWLNKQCSYFHPVKQGALVMMVLPLVCSFVLCPRVRQTHPACDILNLSCKAAFKKKPTNKKPQKILLGSLYASAFQLVQLYACRGKKEDCFFNLSYGNLKTSLPFLVYWLLLVIIVLMSDPEYTNDCVDTTCKHLIMYLGKQ